MSGQGSTVVRRQLGRKLKRLREDAKKTIRSVQDAKLFSESKVARIEAGKIPVKVGDVWTLCRFYGVANAETDALAALSEGTTSDGWWEEYGDAVPEWFGLYIGLEGTCDALSYYHPEVIHGLLQTDSYAEAVVATDGETDKKVIAHRLRVRRDRKHATLERPGRSIRVVLGAGALSLVIGSPEVMAEQREHLRQLSTKEGVEIRVLPWTVGAHPGISGTFTILDFDDVDDPAVVYLESLMGARYLETQRQVAEYRRVFALLEKQAMPIEEYDHER
jgi:transcriptional regulator with XRE-family HTH domain